jgi:hypothetical protein
MGALLIAGSERNFSALLQRRVEAPSAPGMMIAAQLAALDTVRAFPTSMS